MDNFQLYDKSKKGTIIISHYRSGGTQLLLTLTEMLEESGIKMGSVLSFQNGQKQKK